MAVLPPALMVFLKEKATEIIVRANHLDLDPVYTFMHVCDDVEDQFDHHDHHNENELVDDKKGRCKTLSIFHSYPDSLTERRRRWRRN